MIAGPLGIDSGGPWTLEWRAGALGIERRPWESIAWALGTGSVDTGIDGRETVELIAGALRSDSREPLESIAANQSRQHILASCRKKWPIGGSQMLDLGHKQRWETKIAGSRTTQKTALDRYS